MDGPPVFVWLGSSLSSITVHESSVRMGHSLFVPCLLGDTVAASRFFGDAHSCCEHPWAGLVRTSVFSSFGQIPRVRLPDCMMRECLVF